MDNDEGKNVNVSQVESKKGKWNPSVLIFMIALIAGYFYFQKCSTDKSLTKFTTKELTAQGYEVINVEVVKAAGTIRTKTATGKMSFIIRDKDGQVYEGKSCVENERKGIIYGKRKLFIEEIKKKD